MPKLYDILVTIESITKNKCPQGYKVGDEWLVKGGKTPGKEMCASAYNSIAPAIRVLSLGGEHPWDADKDTSYSMCPDSNVGLVFRLRRVR